METSQRQCSDGDCSPITAKAAPYAAFARELTVLVDQLELQNRTHQPVGEIADEVHRLRERAERLLDHQD